MHCAFLVTVTKAGQHKKEITHVYRNKRIYPKYLNSLNQQYIIRKYNSKHKEKLKL